jgi:hypothetical protein
MLEEKEHKVIVIGYSHIRICAAELTETLGKPLQVRGFVKPKPVEKLS